MRGWNELPFSVRVRTAFVPSADALENIRCPAMISEGVGSVCLLNPLGSMLNTLYRFV